MKNIILKIGSAIAALVIINVVGAKIIGANLESGIRASVAAYSEQTKLYMVVSNFKSEWFTSEFQLDVYLPGHFSSALENDTSIELLAHDENIFPDFTVTQHIDHGPIALTDKGPRIGLAFWISEFVMPEEFINDMIYHSNSNLDEYEIENIRLMIPQIQKVTKIDLDGSAGLLGGISNKFIMQGGAFNYKNNDDVINLMIEPIPLEWTLNSSYDASDIMMDWKGVTGNSANDISFTFAGLTNNSTIERVKPQIWIGDTDATFGKISASGPDNTSFDFLGFDALSKIEADLASDSFSMDIVYDFKEIDIKSPAADFKLDGFKVDGSITKIPFSLLELLFQFNERLSDINNNDQEAMSDLFTELMTIVEQGYDGNIKADMSFGNALIESRQGDFSHFDIKPLSGTYVLDNEIKESDTNIIWQGMTGSGLNNSTISIDAITAKTHTFEHQPNLWLGNSELTVLNINAKSATNIDFKLANIDIKGDVKAADDGGNAIFDLKTIIDNVSVNNQTGSYKVDNFTNDISVSKIPFKLIELYQEYTSPFQVEKMQNPTLANEKMLEELATITMQPEIDVNKLDLNLNGELLDSNARITFNEPFYIMDEDKSALLDLNAHIDITERFVNEVYVFLGAANPMIARITPEQRDTMVEQQLKMFVGQGLLNATENGYSADITTDNNFIVINGTPMFPLAMPNMQ